MNKNVIMAIIAVIVVGGGAAWYATSTKTAQSPVTESTTATDQTKTETDPDGDGDNHTSTTTPVTSTDTLTPTPTPTTAPTTAVAVKEFTVIGGNFKYDPSAMTVNKGEKVKITFKNAEGFHDFVIDEFQAKTAKINANQEAVVEFTADKAGTFEYYCSVGSHRAQGMKGTLTVK